MAASSAVQEVRIVEEPATLAYPSRPIIESPSAACLIESKASAPPGSERRKVDFATAEQLADHLKLDPVQSDQERLYILEGLPVEFVQVFGSHFDVDPEVFDSHAVRRSNRLSSLQRNATSSSSKMQAFALDYPELVRRTSQMRGEVVTVNGDLMLPCNTTEMTEVVHHPSVLHPALDICYCHMTLLSFEIDIEDSRQQVLLLLLDSASRAKMNGYELSIINPYSPLSAAIQALPEEKRRWNPVRKDRARQCFTEEVVDRIICSSSPLAFDGIISLLTDLVLPQWKTAFDEFSFNTAISSLSFYETVQQMDNLLNSNTNMHKTKTMNTGRHHEILQQMPWTDLSNRIKRLTELRGWAKMADRNGKIKRFLDDDEVDSDVDGDDDNLHSGPTARSSIHVRGGDLDVETKQSINRVTYLGGVLLPFSIVAAIFSMGDTYSPGGSHFFIFWVIAIPICCITTAVIYADSIRRMTVEQFASQYGAIIKEEKIDGMTDSAAVSLVDSDASIKPMSRWENFRRFGRLLHFSRRRSDNISITDSESARVGSSMSSIHPTIPERKKKPQRTWRWRFWRMAVGAQPDLEHGTPITMGYNLDEKLGDDIPELAGSTPDPVADGEPSALPPITVVSIPEPDNKPARSPLSIHIPTTHPSDPTPPSSLQPPSVPSAPGPSNDSWYPLSPQGESQAEVHRKQKALVEEKDRQLVEEHTRKNRVTLQRDSGSLLGRRRNRVDYIKEERETLDEVDPANIPLPPSPSNTVAYGDFRRNEKSNEKAKKEQSIEEAEERELRDAKKMIEEHRRKADEEEHARRAAAEAEHSRRHTEMNARDRAEIERRRAEEAEIVAREQLKMERRRTQEAVMVAKEQAERGRHRAIEDEIAARERAEMEEHRAKEGKGKGREEESNEAGMQAPIRFTDAVGRKFSFPFHLVKTWAGMESLINNAFVHVDVIGPHVAQGHYDLIGPEDEIILPQVWELVIKPGWAIRMLMWPMSDPPEPPRPSNPTRPPSPNQMMMTTPRYLPSKDYKRPTVVDERDEEPARMPEPVRMPAKKRVPDPSRSRRPKNSLGGGYRYGNTYLGTRPGAPSAGYQYGNTYLATRPGVPGVDDDEVVVIDDAPPPRRMARRFTDRRSERYGKIDGGRMVTTDNPGEEMGWARALGSIVGVKPTVKRGYVHGATYL